MMGGDVGSEIRSDDGANAAMALMRIGPKLTAPSEDMVLELSPGGRSYWAVGKVHTEGYHGEGQQEEPRFLIEEDLVLEDIDSETELWKCSSSVADCARGSAQARKLMEARSQQCIICLMEKEHTLVPWHHCDDFQSGEPTSMNWHDRHASQRHANTHRFCTDCWAEFLQHRLREAASSKALALHCPLCRASIDSPDVWQSLYEVPTKMSKQFRQKGLDELRLAVCLPSSPFWATRRDNAHFEDALEVLCDEMHTESLEAKTQPLLAKPDTAEPTEAHQERASGRSFAPITWLVTTGIPRFLSGLCFWCRPEFSSSRSRTSDA
jgi:hypothetical protein